MVPREIFQQNAILFIKNAIPDNGMAFFFCSTKAECFCAEPILVIWKNAIENFLPDPPS